MSRRARKDHPSKTSQAGQFWVLGLHLIVEGLPDLSPAPDDVAIVFGLDL
jgi:hypothetical protein